jgi:hypothetical protein
MIVMYPTIVQSKGGTPSWVYCRVTTDLSLVACGRLSGHEGGLPRDLPAPDAERRPDDPDGEPTPRDWRTWQ